MKTILAPTDLSKLANNALHVALYTHGHTGLRHLLQGSVSEDVLNHAPLPVLILRINDGSTEQQSSAN